MSQDFPEVESPAGFAALEGSARFLGPAHQGFSGIRCLSGLRDQHTEGADPRTGPLLSLAVGVIFQLPSGGASGQKRGHRPKERLTFLQVSPRLPPAVSPQRGSLPSRSQRLRRACLRAVPILTRSPGIKFQALQTAGSRTLSSTPLGAQRDVALRPPAWRSTRRPRWRFMRQKGWFDWFRLYPEGRV